MSKYNNGCSSKKNCMKPKTCGCSNNNGQQENCNKYKELANEKCKQAECAMNKATQAAQAAKAAEKNAECLKQQAIEECEKANECWYEYKMLSEKASELMEEAQCCMKKAAECYKDLYDEDFGCDLGFCSEKEECKCHGNCNWGCGGHGC